MGTDRAAPSGAGRRGQVCEGGPTARQVMACVLIAFLGVLSFSTLLGPCDCTDGPVEDSSDIPAISLAVTVNSFAGLPNPVYLGAEITFWANATSSTGSPLTFTIFYDYYTLPGYTINLQSPVSVNYTESPGSIVQTHTYNSYGNYTSTVSGLTYYFVRLIVNDGGANVSRTLQVMIKENTAPVFVAEPAEQYSAVVNEPLDIFVRVLDYDSDPIDVFWEFGDGAEATNHTDGTLEDSYANQTHTWSPDVAPGTGDYFVEYQMNVTIVDIWGNSTEANSTILVYVPENVPPTIALSSSSSRIQPGESVTFYGNASDPEGEPLTWTFNYSDGTIEVVHTDWTEPDELVWCNMTHVFDDVGAYTISMYVSDALPGSQVFPHNTSVGTSVTVAVNRVPGVSSLISVTPEYPIINSTIGSLDLAFSISANDLDGDVLTASWYIDDSEEPVVNTSAGGTGLYKFIQVLTVTETGSYNVTVVVTDGYEGHEVTLSTTVNVSSNNRAPVLLYFDFVYAGGEYALPGEDIGFTIVLTDRERDVLGVIFDFGDDSGTHWYNISDYDSAGNVTLIVNHTFEHPGVFTVTLRYTDYKVGVGNHTKVITSEVTVQEAYVRPVTEWDWWDYTSLALVFVIPVLVVVRMLMIRRRVQILEKEGLTLNEARIKAEEQFAEKLLREGREGGV